MSDINAAKRPAHRPPLSDEQHARILGALLMLKKRTPEYRRRRRELATEMDRTERAIEIVFEQLKARYADTPNQEAA